MEVCKSGGQLLESENKFCHFPGEFYFLHMFVHFSFPYVCDSLLAEASSVSGAGEIDGWEDCRSGETIAAMM